MTPISPDQLIAALDWRYATKRFDPTKKIPADTWAALERSLVLTPSSFGLQPWKFIVVTNPAVRKELLDASWKQTQVTDCSHHVVFARHKGVDEAFVDKFLARQMELRDDTEESLAGYRGVMTGFVKNIAANDLLDHWASRQVYIALGQFMAAAALLGVDACPMEGIRPAAYDEILGLKGTDYATMVSCAAGYRAADDKYATAAKVRFAASELIEHI